MLLSPMNEEKSGSKASGRTCKPKVTGSPSTGGASDLIREVIPFSKLKVTVKMLMNYSESRKRFCF